jgi:tetratricopeptide (TPR) repeat protein
MTADDNLVFTLAWDDIALAALPADSQQPGSEAFRLAVTDFLRQQYEPLGGKAQIIFNDSDRTLTVRLATRGAFQSVEDRAHQALAAGNVNVAIPLLRALIAAEPDNASPLFNLGMVYSDQGRLLEAKELLQQAANLDPGNAQIFVAIGVVQARAGDLTSAIATFEQAIKLSPKDPFAHQNLGACLLKQGEAERAESHFRTSLTGDPSNIRSQFGLAQTLETLDRLHDADEVYQEIIKSAGHTQVGEWAKEGRTRIAHALLRKQGGQRPDVLMYCLGALERFEGMSKQEIQAIGQEIAVLGMKGLDINDSSTKYTLRLLPGAFSGLHLVSMMYVAYQQFAPDLDVGIDLAAEYTAAKALHDSKRG